MLKSVLAVSLLGLVFSFSNSSASAGIPSEHKHSATYELAGIPSEHSVIKPLMGIPSEH